MFTILLLVSSILPTVLGSGCCFPNTMKALVFDSRSPIPSSLLVDFTQQKFITRQYGDNVNTYKLTDMKAGKVYQVQNGNCLMKGMERTIFQCIPDSAINYGFAYFGGIGNMKAKTYKLKTKQFTNVVTVTKECVPVVFINKVLGGDYITHIYANVTSHIQDLSDLDHDISNCEEVIG